MKANWYDCVQGEVSAELEMCENQQTAPLADRVPTKSQRSK